MKDSSVFGRDLPYFVEFFIQGKELLLIKLFVLAFNVLLQLLNIL